MYPRKFIRDNVVAPFLLLCVVIVTCHSQGAGGPYPQNAMSKQQLVAFVLLDLGDDVGLVSLQRGNVRRRQLKDIKQNAAC